MNRQILHQSSILVGLLLLSSFALGCATVIKPVSSSGISAPNGVHGLAFGTIHLIRNGKDQTAGLKWPGNMKWWVEDETDGKRFLISHLPLDGQFILKLPPGSYRVVDITFDGTRGIWHTLLPTTFRIQSNHCTSLGMWELEMQAGFFAGWMTRHVSHDQPVAQDDLEIMLGVKDCPTLVAPLESPVKRSVKLHFPTRGSGRF
jgi:hypothetical protein